MSRTMILALAVAVVACSGEKKKQPPTAAPDPTSRAPASARPASITDDDVTLADDWTALYGKYASAMEGAQGDCARVVAAVRDVNQSGGDLIAKGKARMAALRSDPAAAKWLDDNYRAKLGAELDRMAPTLDKCRGNAEVSAALAAGAFERPE